jgi:tungstate transport system substrate-binding protein
VDQPQAGGPANNKLTVATTDSLSSSGLLPLLIDDFQNKTGYEVKVEAGGAGRAFRLGEKFVADVLLVNDPGTEQKYLKDGYAKDRQIVMHTDYVLLGPADDPAGVKGSANAVEALKKIADKKALFYSRSTESSLSALEARLWKNAGITPSGSWYVKTEEGVVGSVKIASDKGAYTLAARSSYLEAKNKNNSKLAIVLEGDPALFDIYHVLPGNGDKSPKINTAGAQAFVEYILSPEAQAIISAAGKDVYGEPIFFGDAGKGDY